MALDKAKGSLGSLSSVADFKSKFKQLEDARKPLEQQWKVNLAFYKGNQYTYYNEFTKSIEQLVVDEGRLPKGRKRFVSNQIQPGVQSLVSKLTKTRPVFTATPGSSSVRAVKAAQMAERLFEYWWDEFNLTDKEAEALTWARITGQGYWKITWDKYSGKGTTFTLDPQGNPITNDSLIETYSEQLKQMGQELPQKTVYLGDIRIEVVSPFDVFLDNSTPNFDDCNLIICRHRLDPDEIQVRWGKTVEPDCVAAEPDMSLPLEGSMNAMENTLSTVYIGYIKPCAAKPEGGYKVWTNTEKEFLESSKWPYPFDEQPIVKFPGIRVPGSIYDLGEVHMGVPVQKELNRTISQIVEYKDLTITPQWLAPLGSLPDISMTNEPGLVYEYALIGQNAKPEPVPIQALPPYVFNHLENISARLNDVFNVVDVTEGKLPPNLEAGVAIDLLQEMASDKFAPTVRLIENALEKAGQIMLVLAQKNYIEPRLVKIRGTSGASQIKEFTKADLNASTSVNVEAGSGLPRTRAGREMRIMRLVEQQIIAPQDALKYLDIADLSSIQAKLEANEDQAQRAIDNILGGRPVNEEAQAMAMQTLQSGQNPETGQPWASPAEMQAFMSKQTLMPPITADYNTFLQVVGLFMKSVEYEELPMETRQQFITFYENIMTAIQSQPAPANPADPPKVTMQIKGTAGPTAASEILKASGLSTITPEIMTEKPLETWVTDSADKPNVQETGNMPADPLADQMNQASIMQKMAAAEQLHGAAMDQAQHQSDQSQHATQQAELKTVQEHSKTRQQLIKESQLANKDQGQTNANA